MRVWAACFVFRNGREYRGEKQLKAGFVELAVVIAAFLFPVIAGLAKPFLRSPFALPYPFAIIIHYAQVELG